MASYGTGFAAGLNSGMSMGKMLMDTYNDAKQKDDLEKAGSLDQTEVNQMTSEHADTLRNIESTKNADGTNAYVVEKLDDGTARFRAAGDENAEWGSLGLTKQYKLGNQTRDTAFTKDEVARARNEAISEAYTKNGDPARGLQYKNAAREDRAASALEAAREEYTTGLEDMASGRNMDKYIPMILRSYNDARKGSKYDDGHNATYDPERNIVAFADKDGRIVNTIPLNQQTLAAAWKERYLDKIEAFDPKLGLERGKITETGRHNRAIESIYQEKNDIDRSKVGLLGGGGGANSFKVLEQKAGALSMAYRKADPNMSQADADKRAWQVLTRDTAGLKGEEAQVEYDDGNGLKIKGTPGQVHNSRMKIDGSYRAANGGDLTMPPPASNQSGRPAANPGKAPARQAGISDAELNTMISDASRGGSTGKAYLTEALNSGELNLNQRQRVEKALKTR